MLRKVIYLSILASLFAGMLRAQDFGTLSGFVVNEAGEPLEQVTIQLIGANRITNTNSAGNFRFTRIPFGEYVVQVSHIGYEDESRKIRHEKDNTEMVTVRLRADVNQLGEVSVHSSLSVNQELDPSKQDYLIEGKKTEGIQLEKLDADITQKNARQIFARIPGIFVYDMDGSGNQVNISSRGLDPHRSWEFNVRMDGIITNSDMYGYPASHFSMPMESVEKIELIHGTAALQYGAQFGGMLNYISKKGDSTRKIGFETIHSAGSFGMLSTYNAVGGKVGKLRYYTYFSKRGSDGFRDHARSDYESEYINLTYDFNANVQLEAGLARSVYTYAIPGPLTEAEFLSDPRQASRKRNYYSPDIIVPSLRLKARLRNGGTINWLTSAVLGERSSVQFTGVSGVADVQDASGKWPARQVDIDNYHSFTSEFMYRKTYRFLNRKAALNSGIRLISNDLYRRQKGKAATDFGDDYSVTSEGFERDLHYYTNNAAVFAEQSVHISDRFVINTGFRLEKGLTRMRGRITNYSERDLPNDINHAFVLPGISFERQINSRNKVFGGWSQAYRPVIFADIIPANAYERADRNLKDAKGHISELGVQGNSQDFRFRYSVNLFEILYRNRMGKQMIEEEGQTLLFRTNVGNSLTYGVESYLSFSTRISKKFNLSVFSSTSFMHGSYLKGMVTNGKTNESVKGNLLETVPQWISRNGITISGRIWSSTVLGSYTSSFFSDPLNTVFVANGTVGKVPGYFLLDWNSTFQVNQQIHLRLALNNVLNKTYYTKRPNGYPGPGIWPSDGRSASFTLGLKI